MLQGIGIKRLVEKESVRETVRVIFYETLQVQHMAAKRP